MTAIPGIAIMILIICVALFARDNYRRDVDYWGARPASKYIMAGYTFVICLAVFGICAITAIEAFAGTTEIPKLPACSAVKAVVFVQKPLLINIFAAHALMREYHKSQPCNMRHRVRSLADGKCYLPGRKP